MGGNNTNAPRPETTLVIMLGASEWPKYAERFDASPAFEKSASELKKYLLAEGGFNLPQANLLDLFDDRGDALAILRGIKDFLGERQKGLEREGLTASDLIFYYVGHAGFSDKGKSYFLTIRETAGDFPDKTGVQSGELAKALGKAGELRQYIILDCCFAASAYSAFEPKGSKRPDLENSRDLPVSGNVLLCASGSPDTATTPPGLGYTMFSWALLEVLKKGAVGQLDRLSLRDLREQLWDRIRGEFGHDGVRPEVHAPKQRYGDVSEVPIFPNPRGSPRLAVDVVTSEKEWLENGKLWICTVRPPPPSDYLLGRDQSRGTTLALAEALLGLDNVAKNPEPTFWQEDVPGLVIFPELAFGTRDLSHLHSSISRLRQPAVVLAGFSLCSGKRLAEMLEVPSVSPLWQDSSFAIRSGRRYSGGWCWIHRSSGDTRCILFLKGSWDRSVDDEMPTSWSPGGNLLRLETEDLVIFPLLGGELTAVTSGNPLERIRESLIERPLRRGQRLVVAAMACSAVPSYDTWLHAIDQFVSRLDGPVVVVVVNHLDASAPTAVTGVFVDRGRQPPGVTREVRTGTTTGAIIRFCEAGAASGFVGWSAETENRNQVWEGQRFLRWSRHRLLPINGNAEAYELRRLLQSRHEQILRDVWPRTTIEKRLVELETELAQVLTPGWLQNCWPRLLCGMKAKTHSQELKVDCIPKVAAELDRAFLMVTSLISYARADLCPKPLRHAQLLIDASLGPRHVMVWVDHELFSYQQFEIVRQWAYKGGSSPPLYVIAAGKPRGNEPPPGVLRSRRSITDPGSGLRCITSPGNRVVYWRRLGDFEDVLMREPGSDLKQRIMGILDLQ